MKLVLLFLFTINSNCHIISKKIKLYENYQRVDNFWEILNELKAGPQNLIFGFSNIYIKIIRIKTVESASIICVTVDGKILRINKSKKQDGVLKLYYNIYKDLKSRYIRVVDTITDGYNPEHIEYLLHENIDIEFDLHNFVRMFGSYRKRKKRNERMIKIYQKFLNFMRTISDYTFIEDLHPNNLVFSRSGEWIPLDFGTDGKESLYFDLSQEMNDKLKKYNTTEEKFEELKQMNEIDHNIFTYYRPNKEFFEFPNWWMKDINENTINERISKLITQI